MTTYTRLPTGHTPYPQNAPRDDGEHCDPGTPATPADQPKDPGCDCADYPVSEPPVLKEPDKCEEPDCNCPKPPTSTISCLDKLIAQQAKEISEADRAKLFKADLEALLVKTKAATVDYTQEKYTKLVNDWWRLDGLIAELIRKLVCAVPCWKCLIECYVCPLLYEIRYREQLLYGDGTQYSTVGSLYDLRYWHDRNRDTKRRALDRIKAVLAAWEKPAQTIEKTLTDNEKLIADAGKLLAANATSAVYDVFLRLVPLHLAIAPPASSGNVTRISSEYTEICECDEGYPDDCCGPDLGVTTLRQRLIGPQPYLILPGDYYEVICCITKKRYLPAKDAWSAAESMFESIDAQIKTYQKDIDDKLKALEKSVKAALPQDSKILETPQQDPTAN